MKRTDIKQNSWQKAKQACLHSDVLDASGERERGGGGGSLIAEWFHTEWTLTFCTKNRAAGIRGRVYRI